MLPLCSSRSKECVHSCSVRCTCMYNTTLYVHRFHAVCVCVCACKPVELFSLTCCYRIDGAHRILVATSEGRLYIGGIDPREGGDCRILKEFRYSHTVLYIHTCTCTCIYMYIHTLKYMLLYMYHVHVVYIYGTYIHAYSTLIGVHELQYTCILDLYYCNLVHSSLHMWNLNLLYMCYPPTSLVSLSQPHWRSS